MLRCGYWRMFWDGFERTQMDGLSGNDFEDTWKHDNNLLEPISLYPLSVSVKQKRVLGICSFSVIIYYPLGRLSFGCVPNSSMN